LTYGNIGSIHVGMPEKQEIAGAERATREIQRDTHGRFALGYSGNPGGRPEGALSLTAILRKIVNSRINPNDPKDLRTYGEALIVAAIRHARDGNARFFREIMERVDGKVPDRIETELGGNWTMVFETAEAGENASQAEAQKEPLTPPTVET
jgi:hypothetical protein